MLTRKLTRFGTVCITILTAYLISDYILLFLEDYKEGRTYKSVLITMVIIIAVYYPALTFLEKYIKKISAEYIKSSKGIAKSSIIGLLVGFIVAFFILFSLFAHVWYNLNILKDITNLIF